MLLRLRLYWGTTGLVTRLGSSERRVTVDDQPEDNSAFIIVLFAAIDACGVCICEAEPITF